MFGSAESERPRLTYGEIISEEESYYVITIHQRYRQTDRRTDRRHAIGKTAFCTKVHRAVKTSSLRLRQYGLVIVLYRNFVGLGLGVSETRC